MILPAWNRDKTTVLAGLPMNGVRLAPAAVLLHFEPIGGVPTVLGRAIIPLFAISAFEINDHPHRIVSSLCIPDPLN